MGAWGVAVFFAPTAVTSTAEMKHRGVGESPENLPVGPPGRHGSELRRDSRAEDYPERNVRYA
jgi:hypothetical protein